MMLINHGAFEVNLAHFADGQQELFHVFMGGRGLVHGTFLFVVQLAQRAKDRVFGDSVGVFLQLVLRIALSLPHLSCKQVLIVGDDLMKTPVNLLKIERCFAATFLMANRCVVP